MLDLDNLQLEKLEKVKTATEKQAKPENREEFSVTLEINSILNTQDPIKVLADKNYPTQTSFQVSSDQDGVNNIGQKQLQLRWELIDELKQ